MKAWKSIWFVLIALVTLLFVSFSSSFSQEAVTAQRELPDRYTPGAELTVTINIDVDEANAPTGLIVKEYVPLDPSVWNVPSSTPAYNSFDPTTGEIKWVFFSAAGVEDAVITYTAQVPDGATGTHTFSGILRYVLHDQEIEVDIGGDSEIEGPPPPLTCGVSTDPDPPSGVAPLDVSFTGTASDGVPPYSFSWNFGDGESSTEQNPPHTYQSPGDYKAVLTVTDSAEPADVCTSSVYVHVEIPELTCDAQADPTSGVAPLEVSFTGTASGGVAPYSFAWDFGDGETSDGQNVTHTYQNPGDYTAVLKVIDSADPGDICAASVDVHVGIPELTCDAQADPASGTAPLGVSFTGTASGGVAPYSFSWDFGDGGSSAEQNPTHTYGNPGDYTAVLTVTDSAEPASVCEASADVHVEAPPELTCDAQADPTSGIAPLEVKFTGSADGGIPPYSFSWDFGDGESSTEQNPTHTYQNPGDYKAVLTVTDSADPAKVCRASADVHVEPPPELTCDAQADPTSGIVPLEVRFTGSADGGVPPYSFSWDFGDGESSTEQNPTHTYQNPGDYTAVLTVTDSADPANVCEDSADVHVEPPELTCDAQADPASGIAPLEVNFTGSADGGIPPYSFCWDFGDGGSSSEQNPTHEYAAPGDYTAELTVSDSAEPASVATCCVEVHVGLPVTAERAFDPDPCEQGAQLTVTIKISVDEAKAPSGLIVRENVPLDPSLWNITCSDPVYNNFDPNTGEIKWVFTGADVRDRTLTYEVLVPIGARGPYTFTGLLRYLVAGQETEVEIGGDDEVEVMPPGRKDVTAFLSLDPPVPELTESDLDRWRGTFFTQVTLQNMDVTRTFWEIWFFADSFSHPDIYLYGLWSADWERISGYCTTEEGERYLDLTPLIPEGLGPCQKVSFVIEIHNVTRVRPFYLTDWHATAFDPASGPQCLGVSVTADGKIQLTWKSISGLRYVVYRSKDLKTWNPTAGPMTAEASISTWLGDPEGQREFYRVKVLPPD